MKTLLLFIFMTASAVALTPREREWVQGIQAAAREDRAAREVAVARANNLLSSLDQIQSEILLKEKQTKQVAKERDEWQAYGNEQHDKWKNAEVRVAKANGKVGWLVAAVGFLTITNVVTLYLLLKP